MTGDTSPPGDPPLRVRPAPWTSIHASREWATPPSRRAYGELNAGNPCIACEATYCCWYVKLSVLRMANINDVDYAKFILGFADMEILVQADGAWIAYLRRPCRHLDQATGLCTVRGTDLHPMVCRGYSPYHCWYQRVISGREPETGVRVDLEIFNAAADRFVFDELGAIVERPTLADLARASDAVRAALETAGAGPSGPASGGAADGSHDGCSVPPVVPPVVTPPSSIPEGSPCGSCNTACCKLLLFPVSPFATLSDVDFYRYVMGLPGVRVVVSPKGPPRLAVRTTCRYLDATTSACSIVGDLRRPKRCEFMSEWDCGVRAVFHLATEGMVVLRTLDAYRQFASMITYDDELRVRALPSAAELRRALGAAETDPRRALEPSPAAP